MGYRGVYKPFRLVGIVILAVAAYGSARSGGDVKQVVGSENRCATSCVACDSRDPITLQDVTRQLQVTLAKEGARFSGQYRLDRNPWSMYLLFQDYGRGPITGRLGTYAPPFRRGDVVLYDRGSVTEWYRSTPRGIEQGFVLEAPPANRNTKSVESEVLTIGLSFEGSLRPQQDSSGNILFRDESGRVAMRYSHLVAWDANARLLPTEMVLLRHGTGTGRIELVVDDTGAEYPITVDPTASSAIWISESDQAGALWGSAVANAGDVNGDGFEDVIVGAPSFDNSPSNEGAAFLFFGSAAGIGMTPDWTAEGGQFNAEFGVSLAAAGDVNGDGFADVIVGAPRVNLGSAEQGAAYVYHGSAVGLPSSETWRTSGIAFGVHFGTAVAGVGDVNGDGFDDVVVGAPNFNGTTINEGRVSLYLGSSSGLSTARAWTAQGNLSGSAFGESVAGVGDVNGDGFDDFVVGAPSFSNGQSAEGRVFLYLGSATGPATTADWTAESNQAGSSFGATIGGGGDVNGDGFDDVIVGAPGFDGSFADGGLAVVFHGSVGGLASVPDWSTEGAETDAALGTAVTLDGDVNGDGFADAIVGAPRRDNGDVDEGMVFLFQGGAGGLSTVADGNAEGNQADAAFGTSVGAGDVDDDGFDDLFIGSPQFDNGETDEGQLFVYAGTLLGGCLVTDDDGDGLSGCGGDNCPRTSNPSQQDFDGDGIGDVCEDGASLADADNSLRVDGFDLAAFSRAFGLGMSDPGYDSRVDFNRDGVVDGSDLAILATSFGVSVG